MKRKISVLALGTVLAVSMASGAWAQGGGAGGGTGGAGGGAVEAGGGAAGTGAVGGSGVGGRGAPSAPSPNVNPSGPGPFRNLTSHPCPQGQAREQHTLICGALTPPEHSA